MHLKYFMTPYTGANKHEADRAGRRSFCAPKMDLSSPLAPFPAVASLDEMPNDDASETISLLERRRSARSEWKSSLRARNDRSPRGMRYLSDHHDDNNYIHTLNVFSVYN